MITSLLLIALALLGATSIYSGRTEIGFVSLLISAIVFLATGDVLFYYWRPFRIVDSEISLPLISDTSSTGCQETLRGSYRLASDGSVESRLDLAQGEVSATLACPILDKRLETRFRRRFRLARSAPVPCTLGYLLLDGEQTKLINCSERLGNRVNTVVLRRELDRGDFGSEDFFSNVSHRETFDVDDVQDFFQRIQISPRLLADQSVHNIDLDGKKSEGQNKRAEGYALDLVVQFRAASDHAEDSLRTGPRIRPTQIASLSVQIPREVETVDVVTGPDDVEPAIRLEREPQEAEWQNIRWSMSQAANGLPFHFQFKYPIQDLKSKSVRGKLRLICDGSISGVESVRFYSVDGQFRNNDAQVRTLVEVEFDLDLTCLQLESVVKFERTIRKEGTVPLDKLVARLLQLLRDRGDLFVSRMIEEAPRSSNRAARFSNRYWDLAGRQYDRILPTDFHIVLSGDETVFQNSENGGSNIKGSEYKGFTQVELTVIGSVANRPTAPTSGEAFIKVWHLEDYEVYNEFRIPSGTVDAVTATPVASVVSTSDLRIVEAHDVSNPLSIPIDNVSAISAFAISPDGSKSVCVVDGKVVYCKLGLPDTHELHLPSDSMRSVAVSNDGQVVFGFDNGSISVWAAERGDRETSQLYQHETSIKAVGVSPGGKKIVSASSDGVVRFWDTVTNQDSPTGLKSGIRIGRYVVLTDDASRVVMSNPDGGITVWGLQAEPKQLEHGGKIRGLAIDEKGHTLVSVSHALAVSKDPCDDNRVEELGLDLERLVEFAVRDVDMAGRDDEIPAEHEYANSAGQTEASPQSKSAK